MEHLEAVGFVVEIEKVKKISLIKDQHKIPDQLRSCHTAIVDGYIVEGHVPKDEIIRMLQEKPNIIGLSVPGMPIGSPGMEMEDSPAEPYRVIAFDGQGRGWVFASYPK